jgi:hypothetical protein
MKNGSPSLRSRLKALIFIAAASAFFLGAYAIWEPGERVIDGRHDLRSNGIWIQHGWLGDRFTLMV